MKNTIVLEICFLLIITYITNVESGCTSVCNDDCNTSDCLSGCGTNCQPPCQRKCNKNNNCRSTCAEEDNETILMPPRVSGTNSSNVNDINNKNNVDINPNITITNTITNVNNISVPINVTSVNSNNIHLSTSEDKTSQINARDADCSRRNAPISCTRSQKQIVILPYPQYRTPQIVTPTPQPRKIVQPPAPQHIIIQSRQTPVLPPQRPILYSSPAILQVPQYIPQPQPQQAIYATQPQPCGSPGGQFGSYFNNQPCSQGQQIITTNYPVRTPYQNQACSSRMMYALSSPFVPSNEISQYSGIDQFVPRYGFPQYGSVSSFDSRNGPAQIGPFNSYGLINEQPVFTDVSNKFIRQMPIGVDSYFIPDQHIKRNVEILKQH